MSQPPASSFKKKWEHDEILDTLGSAAPNPESKYPDSLLCVLHSTVVKLMVEFQRVGEPQHEVVKPHVVFHLLLQPCHVRQVCQTCRLSMDYTAVGPNGVGGSLALKGADFIGSHRMATGSFGFVATLKGQEAKVQNWIKALLGHYDQPPLYPGSICGDMTEFEFTQVKNIKGAESQMDGCRDWIAQAFTRFYLAGWVALSGLEVAATPIFYNGQEVKYLNFNQVLPRHKGPIDFAPYWFPDIIEKKFTMTPSAQYPYGVTIQSIPMWRGTFLDKSVVRHEKVTCYRDGKPQHTFHYKYLPLSRPGSAGDSSKGGIPPRGRPGNPGPSTTIPDRSRDLSASRSSGLNPPNTGAVRGNKNSGGGSESGKALSATQVRAWVKFSIQGEEILRDANERPKENGFVTIYDLNKHHIGHFNINTTEYRRRQDPWNSRSC
ncbi:hypothetical protein VM1G_06410 [Cytospora mali]|uniref:Uncharacterized protein n=1 Tax=Cytospora mali TaxID=578113 RepID=A0A194W2Y7_CYTMA|nr:hypothetical protein VM1G_06410 [Valsa mali]